MSSDDERSRDDSLDAAIREALRVDADPLRVARLERYWRRQSEQQLWRRRAVRLISLAAAAVLAFALFALTRSSDEGDHGDVAQAQRAPSPPLKSSDVRPPTASPRPVETAVAMNAALGSREPTAYERFILAARSTAREPIESRLERIEAAVRQMVGDDGSDPQQVLAASGVDTIVAETILLRKLPLSAAAEQAAILKLLTVCGGQRSIPPLMRLGRYEALHDDVLEAIQKIAGSAGLAQAAASAPTSELRTAAMLRLLTSDSEESLSAYLALVHGEATRSAALAAATDAPEVPIPRLLACLDAAEQPVRSAAATVLGHVNGPEITQLLIARVREKPADSTEAWLALMACRGEAAAQFLTYASHRPQLLGHLNNARVRAQMIP